MSNAVEVRVPTEVAAHIRGIKPYLDRLLPDPARFATTLMAAGRRQPEIFNCTPETIIGAALITAQLGLEPGAELGQVWYIPRRNGNLPGRPLELTTMLGKNGMKVLTERHPAIRALRTGTIHRNDQWEHTQEPPSLTHTPAWGDRGEAFLWYAKADRTDGGHPHIKVIDKAEVERRRSHSASPKKGPWVDHYDAMARKSAIRALWPELPSSLDLTRAAQLDDVSAGVTPATLGVPELAAPDGDDDEDAPPERETITVRGELVDEETGEVLGEGDLEQDTDPPERQEDTDAAGPGKPADDEEGGAPADREGPGAPATSQQVITVAHLQGARGLDDHDLCQIIRDRFNVDADTVEAAIGGLTEDQAGDLIVEMQGADEPPPEQA